jgi:hypothetical protein
VELLSDLRRRVLPTLEEEESDPLDWRERMLSTILAVVLVLGVITAVPSITLVWRDGMYGTIAADLSALTARECGAGGGGAAAARGGAVPETRRR